MVKDALIGQQFSAIFSIHLMTQRSYFLTFHRKHMRLLYTLLNSSSKRGTV